jgi:hypothetical protein
LRLLAILAGYVPWDGWQGWEVHGGHLFPPGYAKGGITPGEFFALPYYRQLIGAYQERIRQLEALIGSSERGERAMPAASGSSVA